MRAIKKRLRSRYWSSIRRFCGSFRLLWWLWGQFWKILIFQISSHSTVKRDESLQITPGITLLEFNSTFLRFISTPLITLGAVLKNSHFANFASTLPLNAVRAIKYRLRSRYWSSIRRFCGSFRLLWWLWGQFWQILILQISPQFTVKRDESLQITPGITLLEFNSTFLRFISTPLMTLGAVLTNSHFANFASICR